MTEKRVANSQKSHCTRGVIMNVAAVIMAEQPQHHHQQQQHQQQRLTTETGTESIAEHITFQVHFHWFNVFCAV